MAGDWIKFEKSTLEKPEVFEIAGQLGLDPDAVIGKLLRVWNWFDDQSHDGNAPVTVAALLNRYAGVTGFVEAMQKVGWLEITNDRLILPNFDRHNGTPSKSRAMSKMRQQLFRKSNANSNAGTVTKSVTRPLLEKRREEKRTNTDKHSLAVAIYERYPRKVGKKAALDAINKALKEKDPTELLAAVNRFAASQRDTEERFIPHPATWFNRGSYDDEESPAQTQRTKDW